MAMPLVKPITLQSFRADIDSFLKRHDMSRREIGTRALNDSAFYLRLQKEIYPTLQKVERVYDFMIAYDEQQERAKTDPAPSDTA